MARAPANAARPEASSRLPERRAPLSSELVLRPAEATAVEEIRDRLAKARIGDAVHRPGRAGS